MSRYIEGENWEQLSLEPICLEDMISNEMVYEFLKMEIASDRHKEKIETILKEL